MTTTSMKYRKLDSNGDYLLGHGTQGFLTNTPACAQAVKTKLALYEGEWWEDSTIGLPLWQKILGSPGSKSTIVDSILSNTILDTTGVKEITSKSSNLNTATRAYSYEAYIKTDWSTGITVSTSSS